VAPGTRRFHSSSFSQGALLNLAGDCLLAGAQRALGSIFRSPPGTKKIFFLSLFSILAEIKARKIHLGFETREMKNNKKSMRLGKVSAAEKNSIPAAPCAISHAPWQLHFQFLRNEQINLGPCSTPAQRIDAKLNTDTLVNWLFTESGKVCAQTDADISPPRSHRGRKFLEKYSSDTKKNGVWTRKES
jgi:hypothetical protein